MNNGDIIEIVEHDENALKHLRRVRVVSLRESGDSLRITGVNMLGKFPKDYRLPKQPLAAIVRQPNHIGWLPYHERAGGDE
jgi:hypothetical protein